MALLQTTLSYATVIRGEVFTVAVTAVRAPSQLALIPKRILGTSVEVEVPVSPQDVPVPSVQV